ncbi:MAG: hypothetical protein ABSE22_12960 [Xanthobacteraceae bacterium]
MRQLFLVPVLAVALASCTTSGALSTATVASVQTAAVAACNFLPDVSTITNILTANPAAATAESIAGIICSAITGQPASVVKRRATAPTVVVNGRTIPVTGHFVAAGHGQ